VAANTGFRGLSFLSPRGKDRNELERDLRAAGFTHPDAPLRFAWARLGGALAAGGGTALALWLSGNWHGARWLLAVAATGFAFVGAKLVLRGLIDRRMRRINDELPFALDLMMMLLESGISLDQCFRTLAGPEGSAVPQFRQAMALLVDDIQHGMPYPAALDRWADCLGAEGTRELAGLFRQSLYQGTGLGPALREFALDFADRRVARARESIGRKTAKMAIVMMLFMMPALFIVLCGPAVSTIVATLSGTTS
jgi:tight adherence protein C